MKYYCDNCMKDKDREDFKLFLTDTTTARECDCCKKKAAARTKIYTEREQKAIVTQANNAKKLSNDARANLRRELENKLDDMKMEKEWEL